MKRAIISAGIVVWVALALLTMTVLAAGLALDLIKTFAH